MELTNEKAFAALIGIRELIDKELPAVAALRVRKLHTELSAAWKEVEAVKDLLISRYAEKDEAGNALTEVQNGHELVKLRPDANAEFETSWKALLAEPITVQTQLRMSDLGDVKLTPALLINLGDLLIED
jgi:hypothetical protein